MMDKKPLETNQRLVPVYLNGEWVRTARVGPEESQDELHVTAEIDPQGRLVSRGNHAAFDVITDTARILEGNKSKKDWALHIRRLRGGK